MTTGKRRLGGWGFEGESMAPSPELLAWLGEHIGPAHPIPGVAAPPPELPTDDLGELPAELSTDSLDRLAHGRGQGLVDVLRIRSGLVPALPDAVCRPTNTDEVEAVLRDGRRPSAIRNSNL